MNVTDFCKYITIVLIGFSASAVGDNRSHAPIQASSINAEIKARGAKAVVSALWGNNDQWNKVIANISHGSPEWLQVAVELHPGTDAGSSEMLDEAVFLALKPAPVAILRLIKNQQFSVITVCSSRIGIDYTSDESRRFINERIKKLMNISDSETDSIRVQCLTGLQEALKAFD